MNIDRINHFRKIYEKQGLSKAGLELGLSKTALSLSLKKLEQDLNTKLFTRTTKKMLPTSDGEILYQKSSILASEIAEIKETFSKENNEYTGTFRIGAPVCFSSEFLMDYIRQFISEHTKVNFNIFLDEGSAIKERLERGEIDFSIIGDDIRKEINQNYYLESLYEFELVMVCTPQIYKKILTKNKIDFDKIKKERFVFLKHISIENWFLLHFDQVYSPERFISIGQHHIHIDSLLNGDGIGMQAKYSIQRYLDSGELIEISPTSKKHLYHFYSLKFLDQVPKRMMKKFEEGLKKYLLSSSFS